MPWYSTVASQKLKITVVNLFNELSKEEKEPFKTVRDYIKQQVLNYATMTDLTYHVKLLTFLANNPQPHPDEH